VRSLTLLLLLAPTLAAQQPRDLSGAWRLETPVTALPPAPPPDSLTDTAQAARGPRTRVGRQLALLAGMAGAVPAFVIVQSDSVITVTNEDGFSYDLRPRGPELRLTVADSLIVRYRTRWDGSFLQVEWRPEGGGKITERYQLADSGLYLRVDVTVEYERFRQSVSRLYRKAEEAP